MKIKQKRLKYIAMFLLFNFLQSLFLPTVAKALTSGPTAPEATSFEPVDTTDMVNLQTGDFTYNMPMLEVPGPEGGYPLSLSYHAGIKPLEEASWAGLGWNISPGAINRVVNGNPDDFKGEITNVHDIWEGGETHSFSLGVGIGISDAVKANLSLNASFDTYEGFSGNVGIGLAAGPMQMGFNSSGSAYMGVGHGAASVRANVGTSGSSISAGLSYSQGAASFSAGISTDFNSIGLNAGMSVGNMLSMGYSLSSGQLRSDLSVYGMSITPKNYNSKLTIEEHGIMIPLKFVSLGYNYKRYFIDENADVESYGALYAANATDNFSMHGLSNFDQDNNTSLNFAATVGPRSQSFDSNILSVPKRRRPDKDNSRSMPMYDSYQVASQGVRGNMEPLILENATMFRQNDIELNSNGGVEGINVYYLTPDKGSNPNDFTKKVNFRFLNDFSNSFEYTNVPTIQKKSGNAGFEVLGGATSSPSQGFNPTDQHLAGSKHIEWYSNQEIASGNAPGFMFTDQISDAKRLESPDQIGGFSVTNESGVVYHFGLPAYTYDEYQEVKSTVKGDSWNKKKTPAPKAYTWFLTSITGPDFVDRGTTDKLDEDDWGYWVDFKYGMWTDKYEWRTPHEGVNMDINGQAESFAYGKKELYYLDAIKTRSHTALFVKDIRYDAKSITQEMTRADITDENAELIGTGGVSIKDQFHVCPNNGSAHFSAPSLLPISQLKLNSILLFKNDKLEALAGNNPINSLRTNYNANYDQITIPANTNFCNANNVTVDYHFSDNVITVGDLTGLNLEGNSVKSIWLDTDYSLSPETDNSFDHSNLYQATNASIPSERKGKLTLNSLSVKGYGAQDIMPPVTFSYEDPNPTTTGFDVKNANTLELYNSSGFQAGDIVEFTTSANTYYCLLLNGGGNVGVEFLGKNKTINSSMSGTLKRCSNPPFSAQRYDYWGNYKADVDPTKNYAPSDYARMPTSISADYVDVWSLKSIDNSTGSTLQVNYESKEYSNVVLEDNDKIRLHIDDISITGPIFDDHFLDPSDVPTSMTLEFKEGLDLRQALQVGDLVDFTMMIGEAKMNIWGNMKPTNFTLPHTMTGTITNVLEDKITVNNFNFPSLTAPSSEGYWIDFEVGYLDGNLPSGIVHYGNGIRTKSIKVLSSSGESSETIYNYSNGAISYSPGGNSIVLPDEVDDFLLDFEVEYYLQSYTSGWHPLREVLHYVPGPSVMYEDVEVIGKANDLPLPGKTRYKFRVFEENMIDLSETDASHTATAYSGYNYNAHWHQKFVIKDKTVQIGNLLKVEDLNGQDQVTTSTTYNYADDGGTNEGEGEYDDFNSLNRKQGVVHQAFNEMRRVKSENIAGGPVLDHETIISSVNVYKSFPNLLKSTKVTTNGITTTSKNLEFDFYTGKTLKVETENSYGEQFVASSIPAYEKYPAMGLKVNNFNNKHMLSQNAYTELAKVDNTGNEIGILSASVSTWNDNWIYNDAQVSIPVWRKHKSYVYQSPRKDADGTYSVDPQTFASTSAPQKFNWVIGASQHSNWQQASEITLYDHYSKPLEVMDINANYAATKMGYDESMVLATATNSRYKEFAYASGESGTMASSGSSYDGGVVRATGAPTSTAHTGSLGITSSGKGFKYTVPIGNNGVETDKTYRASVWIHQNKTNPTTIASIGFSVSSNNSLGLLVPVSMSDVKAGDWKLVSVDINLPQGTTGNLEVFTTGNGTTAIFDDFRFHPLDAPMTSYVYDEATGQLRFILDAENFFTEYEYNPDGSGRLYKTYRESTEVENGKRIVSKHEMNYKQ